MYETIIDDGTLDKYVLQAKKYTIEHDRSKYNSYMKVIEEYSAQKKLLISSTNGMKLLCGEPVDINGYYYECYGVDPYKLAVEIANKMYDFVKSGGVESEKSEQVLTETLQQKRVTDLLTGNVDPNTIQVRTEIRNRIVMIEVDGRTLLKINNIGILPIKDKSAESIVESQQKMMELVHPVPRTGYFSEQTIYCLPELNQLITVYRVLCNPARHADWREYLGYESKLYTLCIDELEKSIVKVVEGGSQKQKDTVPQIIYQRMNTKNKIIIGDFADGNYDGRLQFITSEDLVSLKLHIKNIVDKYIGDYDITYKRQSLYVPDDIQLEKYSFYLVDNTKNTLLFDVYNSTSYDILPYRKVGFYKVGNPLTLIKYRFIDLWSFKIISRANPKYVPVLVEKTRETIPIIERLHEEITELLKTNPVKLFSKYTGTYIPDRIAIRRMKTDKKMKVFNKYIPGLIKIKID